MFEHLFTFLVYAEEEAFEVCAFGKGEGDGVIFAGAEVFEDLCLTATVGERAEDDLLEEVGADCP